MEPINQKTIKIRRNWDRNPVEQVVKSKKAYSRGREKESLRDYLRDIEEDNIL